MEHKDTATQIWSWLWRVGIILLVAGAGVGWAISAPGSNGDKCHVNTSRQAISAPSSHSRVLLTAVGKRTTDPPPINFGLSRRDVSVAPYSYAVTGRFPRVSSISWDLLLVKGNESFPSRHAGVRFSDANGQLRVSLCLKGAGVDTGTYAGSLSFTGRSFDPVRLPLTVTLKDNNLTRIWIGIVAAALLAVFVKWWSVQLADKTRSNTPNLGEFVTWIKDQWMTVLIAVVGAAGAVYKSKFSDVKDFTESDRWGLWVAVFTAVTASALLLTALGSALKEPSAANVRRRRQQKKTEREQRRLRDERVHEEQREHEAPQPSRLHADEELTQKT